jgi:quinol monooxygenase YgiN
MNMKQILKTGGVVLALSLSGGAVAAEPQVPFVRIAELEIDSSQLERFESAIKEGIETAVRVEPGVLALYAVAEKNNPNHIRVFEVYTDANAYQVHLETPHFKKFRATTDKMVKSRKLIDAVPVVLGAKAAAAPSR